MTVDQSPGSRPSSRQRRLSDPGRLPLRWAVILGLSLGVGLLVGAAESLAAGVVAGIVALGALHKILR